MTRRPQGYHRDKMAQRRRSIAQSWGDVSIEFIEHNQHLWGSERGLDRADATLAGAFQDQFSGPAPEYPSLFFTNFDENNSLPRFDEEDLWYDT